MTTVEAKIKLPPHPLWLIPLFGIASGFCVLYYALILAGDIEAHVSLYLSLPFSISFGVLNLIFLYRLWFMVQKSNIGIKKPTPGKAVGFMFIPFFNIYWLFIVYRNLSLHLNSLTKYKKISVKIVTLSVALIVSGVFSLIGGIILSIVYFSFYKSAKELKEGSMG